MEEMVIGFLFNSLKDVLLIRKNRPTWQKGRLNGIGGHVEENESPEEAMQREFLEETGLYIIKWKHVGLMSGPDWRVDIFTKIINDKDFSKASSTTDEHVEIHNIKNIYKEIIVPNVLWIVPMCWEQLENINSFNFVSVKYDN